MSCQHGNWPPCEYCDEIETNLAELQREVEGLRDLAERRRILLAEVTGAGMADRARAERLAGALQRWWEGKRPFGWDAAKHCANPAVNCNLDTEVLLAYLAAEEARAALDQETTNG